MVVVFRFITYVIVLIDGAVDTYLYTQISITDPRQQNVSHDATAVSLRGLQLKDSYVSRGPVFYEHAVIINTQATCRIY
jgi:hypothetical protein